MPQTSRALSEVQASIDACDTDIRAAELEISKVEEQLASPGLSSEDKAYWRKEKEQLRKEKEQLRKKEELMLGRAERIEMQAASGACAVFGTRVHLTVHCALIARFSTVCLLLMMVYQYSGRQSTPSSEVCRCKRTSKRLAQHELWRVTDDEAAQPLRVLMQALLIGWY